MKTFTISPTAVVGLFARNLRRRGVGQAVRLRQSIDAWFRSGSGRAPRTMRDAIRSLRSLVRRKRDAAPTQSDAPPPVLRRPVFQQRLAQSKDASVASVNRRSGPNHSPGRAGILTGTGRAFFQRAVPDVRGQSLVQAATTSSVVASQSRTDAFHASRLERAASARLPALPGLAATPALTASTGRPVLSSRIHQSIRQRPNANESPAESMMPQQASLLSHQAARTDRARQPEPFERNLLNAVRRDLSQRAGIRFASALRDRVPTLPDRRRRDSAAGDRLPGESSVDQTPPITESSSQRQISAVPNGESPLETSVPEQRHFQSSDWSNDFQKRREAVTNSSPLGTLPPIR